MPFYNSEKLKSVQNTNLDLLQQITGKVFEGMEKFAQLQIKTLRTTSEEQIDTFRKLLSVRDPKDYSELQASFIHPAAQAQRLLGYSREVYDLISATQAELAKLTEVQVAAGARQMKEMVAEVTKNAPAGAEPVVAVMNSALDSASTVYASAQKAAKQASDIAENGMTAATSAASAAATQAANQAGRAAGAAGAAGKAGKDSRS